MANQANVELKVQRQMATVLAQNTAAFSLAGQVTTGEGGNLSISGRTVGGLAVTLAKTATTMAATDIANFEATVSSVHKVIKHTVNKRLLATEKGFEQIGTEIANKIFVSLNKDYFDFLEGLFAAAHPRAGAGAFQVGAGKKYIDTGLAFLLTKAGAGTQDNLITTAFSETALDAAIQLLNKYKDDAGVPLHLGMNGGLTLVVGPKNRKLAGEVVGSDLSGADMAINTLKPQIGAVVVWNFSTDEDDWFLIDSAIAPVGMHISVAPTAHMGESTDKLFVDFVAQYEAVPFKAPYEQGIIGSNVA
jgi:hypothetical protein